jgi:alginate O-acetyltransferase complex protein AlgI
VLFNSYEFIFIFLPIIVLGYYALLAKRLVIPSKIWLILGSLFFYGWFNPSYVFLLLGSIIVNYNLYVTLSVTSSANSYSETNTLIPRKFLLILGIALNLGLLGYYKYTDFLIENLNQIASLELPLPNILLPIAISFVTFQQIALLVDSYSGKIKDYDFINYMLFITFFPQLIAGPIVHHKEMMPQFASKWNWVRNYRHIGAGLFIFSIGLFKKVVIADTFAKWADQGFDHSTALNFYEAWATSLSYTFQLYFDFSGYADMAIGLALLFNIRLPINFNSPYKALSIQDFWRRWHMTLSRFLRDYLYIPLGGNRAGEISTYINLFLTFVIGGIWHGASWMFVIWGALHGGALIVHRAWQRLGYKMYIWLAWFLTFNFVNVAWVYFRAKDLESAHKVLTGMLDYTSVAALSAKDITTQNLAWGGLTTDLLLEILPVGIFTNFFAYAMFVIAFSLISMKNTSQLSGYTLAEIRRLSCTQLVATSSLLCISCLVMLSSASSVFLYFNF